MSRLESSPSIVSRRAADLDALCPGSPGFALPIHLAPHLSVWRLLAHGSSLVYEGFDRRMGSRVAVKLLAVREDAHAHARLLREAALYANLDHPAVPKLYDVAALSDGTPYVVMEFVAGQTLAELIRDEVIRPSLACDITSQVLGSLSALHRAGIVHRDVKPANIILEHAEDGRRRARLVDFGVAKSSTIAANTKLTQPGALLGTPQYMAPEQLGGAEADSRTDLYAVGLILHEMLTRACPHVGETFAELVAARLRDDLDERLLTRAGVGSTLVGFLRTALARSPDQRFSSAEDMLCELHAARADDSCLWRLPASAQGGLTEAGQVGGPLASVAPDRSRLPQVAIDSAVWGVLSDRPLSDPAPQSSLARRGGATALLLGFGLTLVVAGIVAFQLRGRAPSARAVAPLAAQQEVGVGVETSAAASSAAPLAPKVVLQRQTAVPATRASHAAGSVESGLAGTVGSALMRGTARFDRAPAPTSRGALSPPAHPAGSERPSASRRSKKTSHVRAPTPVTAPASVRRTAQSAAPSDDLPANPY